jgi:hypothetical protein
MWTFQRYRNWMDQRKTWHVAGETDEPLPEEPTPAPLPARPAVRPGTPVTANPQPVTAEGTKPGPGQRIEIEPSESEFGKILRPRTET